MEERCSIFKRTAAVTAPLDILPAKSDRLEYRWSPGFKLIIYTIYTMQYTTFNRTQLYTMFPFAETFFIGTEYFSQQLSRQTILYKGFLSALVSKNLNIFFLREVSNNSNTQGKCQDSETMILSILRGRRFAISRETPSSSLNAFSGISG